MYKKKLSTIAIITILTLSILLAAIPMALAVPPIGVPTLSATSGPVGTKITVSDATGTATAFGLVEVYWDTLATKIKDGYADSAGDYSIANVVIPAGIKGIHYIIVKDVLSSTTNNKQFTITPEIKLSTAKGLPGDSVTVTGTGFGGTTVINAVDVGIGLGAEVAVTNEAVGTGDGATKAFSLDYAPVKPASVTVSAPGIGSTTVTTGTTVTAITVTAPGILANFTAGLYDATGATQLVAPTASTGDNTVADTVVLTYAYVDATVYTVKITFADTVGSYTIAGDGVGGTYGPIAIIDMVPTVNYATGVITFTTAPASGVPITATYTHYTYKVTPTAGVLTSDVGSFSAVIIIPAIPVANYGAYTVTAVDEDGNIDTETLAVDYYVTATPPTGPTGITITIAGRIPASTPYELRIGTTTIATGTSQANTTFSQTYVVSSYLSLGAHTITVVWATVETRTATFTVTAPPQVSYTPISGVAGAVVKISTVAGFPFSANANITVYLGTTVANSTATDDRFGPTGMFTGTFTDLEFTVPTLAPGPYALKVVDQFGASTAPIYTFTVLPTPVTTVAINAASYYPGDTLSFTITTTETGLGTITVTVKDPAGVTWWTTNTWTLTGVVVKSVLYQNQLFGTVPATLPADAPLGSWNWTVTYTPVSTGLSTKATGLFTVAALPTMQTVLDQLDAMEATITGVITTTEGDIIAVINTKTGTITTKLDPLMPKLQGIEDTAVIIATMLGEVQVDIAALDLDAMGVDITAIKGDVATIKTNIGTVTTSVSALDAKVTTLSGNVATVSTTLGTLEGTVTSIDGKVATIDTEVGTLQADVTEILDKPSVDMTPAWIAVVLSLIAAIAAIFAVITIRQKIAG